MDKQAAEIHETQGVNDDAAFEAEQVTYNLVSRVLHWLMASLFLVQIISSISHYFFEDSALEALFWPTHKPLGFLLLVLVFIRLVWAIITLKQRPASMSKLASIGHAVLYGLMFAIPSLALLRQYGSGRAFEPFGLPVLSGFDGDKIKWMIDLGSDFHGELGWALFILVAGHIGMVIIHQVSSNHEKIFHRMWRK